MDKDPRANPERVAGRMPRPGGDPAASTKIGPVLADPADDPPSRHETGSAPTGQSEPEPGDARQQILSLKAQAEELRIVGYKWQKAAQAALAAERQLTALEADRDNARSERDDSLAKAAEAQAIVDAARKRSVALEADLEKVRGERNGALAKVAEAEAAADEARKRSAALEADLDKVRSDRDGALAKVEGALAKAEEAKAVADEAQKRSAALEADRDKVRGERDVSLAKAEVAERALQAEGAEIRASRRELALNGIVALIFVVALLLLLIFRS